MQKKMSTMFRVLSRNMQIFSSYLISLSHIIRYGVFVRVKRKLNIEVNSAIIYYDCWYVHTCVILQKQSRISILIQGTILSRVHLRSFTKIIAEINAKRYVSAYSWGEPKHNNWYRKWQSIFSFEMAKLLF